jgi:hypothetical protein
MSKNTSKNQRDWQDRLPMVAAAYNVCIHSATGYTPFYPTYGREYKTPLDVTLDVSSAAQNSHVSDYGEEIEKRSRSAYVNVQKLLRTNVQRMKQRYDRQVHEIKLKHDLLHSSFVHEENSNDTKSGGDLVKLSLWRNSSAMSIT